MRTRNAMIVALVALIGLIRPAQAQDVGTVELVLLARDQSLAQMLLRGPNHDFFMTAYPAELAAVTSNGWHRSAFDGQIFVFNQWVRGTVPLYRFVHPRWGQHFFTWNRAEAQAAVSRHGYSPEGICCYISPSPTADTVPLFRLRRLRGVQYHYYVTNEYARARMEASGEFVFEGIAGYVWPRTATAALETRTLEPLCFSAAYSAAIAQIRANQQCVP